MRATEDLLSAVRNASSRRYLAEAVRSYNAGAFRSSIISTWVAVAVDLIGKIRELAAAGEPAAAEFCEKLDNAIKGGNVGSLRNIERALLETALEKFELIDRREKIDLERLVEDRHVCAHPAFVDRDQVFEPTPELVRNHISSAVDSLLSKGSTPGKKAIERFESELLSGALPVDQAALSEYLRDRFFQRGKASLRRSLAKLMIKYCIDPPEGDVSVAIRCGSCVSSLASIEPGLLRESLNAVIGERESGRGLSDREVCLMVGSIGHLQDVWDAIPETSLPRLETVIRLADVEDLVEFNVFSQEPNIPLGESIRQRIGELNSVQLARVIGQKLDPSTADAAVRTLEESGSFRAAEANMEDLILPLAPTLEEGHVRRVLSAITKNNQIHLAAKMPSLMVTFFRSTRDRFPKFAIEWYELEEWLRQSQPDDPDGYYTYPELRDLITNEVPF